jgi:Ca-activated chloride channel family protein
VIESLHFIRPLWLIALPVIALVWWLVRRRDASQVMVGHFVAPHLREALTVNRNARRGLRAIDGVAIALLATSIAAAGPTWSKQASPDMEQAGKPVVQ